MNMSCGNDERWAHYDYIDIKTQMLISECIGFLLSTKVSNWMISTYER